MSTIIEKTLLKNTDVLNEINKHKWIASEKAGRDIGFEKACWQWINRHSASWLVGRISKKLTTPIKFK